MLNVPKCPHCETNEYVILKSTCKSAGTLIGAGAGYIGATSGASSGAVAGAAIGSFVPLLGTAIGAVTGGVLGGLLGAAGGAKIGSEVGEVIDKNVINTYKCNKCGREFEG